MNDDLMYDGEKGFGFEDIERKWEMIRLSLVAVSSEGKWIIRYKYGWYSRRW